MHVRKRCPFTRCLFLLATLSAIMFVTVFFKDMTSSHSVDLIVRGWLDYSYQSTNPSNSNNHIKIGIVACASGQQSREDVTNASTTLETLTLIKSALISAKMYNVNDVLQFYVFTNSYKLENVLREKFEEYLDALNGAVKAEVHFSCVFRSFPKIFQNYMPDLLLKSALPCTYIRIFFPYALSTLDEILYLDTDVIITGNISAIWEKFRAIADTKLVVIMPNTEPEDKNFGLLFKNHFSDIPHIPPKGANAGVMFMNLAGMRDSNWTSGVLQVYDKYKKTKLYINDQRLINIYFHDHPSEVILGPCNLNFMHVHCDNGLTCEHAQEDPNGILMLHGAGSTFEDNNAPFVHFYQAFKKFDLQFNQGKIIDELIVPIKLEYTAIPNAENATSKCRQVVGPLLFRNLFEWE